MSVRATEMRSARQVWAAAGSSHDKVIRIARIVLPIGIAILVVLLAIAPITVGRDISFVLSKNRVQVAHERLKVTQALYRGQDAKGEPFQLRAKSAVQVSSRDPVVRLSSLIAAIKLQDGPATVQAPRGRYDMGNEKIYIDGPVQFKSADGYQLNTRDVRLDMNSRIVTSGGAVDGNMPLGTFAANHLTADLNSRVVVLDGGASLHIVQRQARGTK
jgi:lipopolysaccharide export system protein LptC